MKRSIAALLMILVFATCASAQAEYAEGQVLVVAKNNNLLAHTSSAQAASQRMSVAESIASTVDGKAAIYDALSSVSGNIMALVTSDSKTADEMEAELKRNPNVIAVSKNYLRKALPGTTSKPQKTPASASGTGTRFSEQWGLEKIKAPEALKTTEGSSDVAAAVLDAGVMYDHPDLKDNM